MPKYHVNPETGKAGPCRATKQCRFGSHAEHYDSKTAAQEGYEKAMNAQAVKTFTAAKPKTTAVTTPLSRLMDSHLLSRMISEGYIMVQTHPDDPSLKVMTYSKTAQSDGKWNDATKQARGLIIRAEKDDLSDAVVLERPWRKFFSLEQIRTEDGRPGWALGDEEEGAANSANNEFDKLDFHAPAEVTDKMDGSLGILYTAPDGKLALATKGSFASDQALAYTKMLRGNETMYAAAEKLKADHPDTTYLFELVGKDNQIVLEYDKDDIAFLGAVNKDSGVYYSTSDFKDTWGDEQGLSRAEVMHANNLEEALAMPDRLNKEGVVVRFKTTDPEKQMQVKIKQGEYKRLHRLLSAVSKKGTRTTLRETEGTIADVVAFAKDGNVRRFPKIDSTMDFFEKGGSPLHQRLYAEQEVNFREAMMPRAQQVASAYERVMEYPDSAFQGDQKEIMKNFAMNVSKESSEVRGYLFSFFRSRLQGKDIASSNAQDIFKGMAGDY